MVLYNKSSTANNDFSQLITLVKTLSSVNDVNASYNLHMVLSKKLGDMPFLARHVAVSIRS